MIKVDLSHNNLTEISDQLIQDIISNPKVGCLDLSHNKIKTLPPALSSLTQLVWLNLSHNEMIELPHEIGELRSLMWLNLSHNQLATLPLEIGKLTRLSRLFLSHNKITVLPPEIRNLKSLTRLFLSHNQLTEVPPEIIFFTQLKKLSLANNQITRLPPEIGKLTQLTQLDLSRTQITSLPIEMNRCTSLKKLFFVKCGLVQTPFNLSELNNLIFLNLSHNPLVIFSEPWTELKGLESLYISHCGLQQLPVSLIRLHLKKLNLSHNPLEVLPAGFKVLTLDLSSCGLRTLPETLLCQSVVKLNLSHNPLKVFPRRWKRFTNIESLDLSHCGLQYSPASLAQLSNLRQLNLSHNPLKALPERWERFTNLESLDLSNCGLQDLPGSLSQLHLKKLNLSHNPLVATLKEWEKLTNLESLDLSHCGLQQSPLSLFQLNNLRRLNLSHNPLVKGLPKQLRIIKLSPSGKLNLSKCGLSAFPEILHDLSMTKHLDLSHNPLVVFPEEWEGLTNLLSLDLSHCELQNIPPSLAHLKSLRKLNLSHNPLRDLSADLKVISRLWTKDLPQFTLDLSNQELKEIPKAILSLPLLQHLNLSHNPLTVLPREWDGLTSLRTLDLSHCELREIAPSFTQLNNLIELNLSHNPLELSSRIFPKISNLHLLDLSHCNLQQLPLFPLHVYSLKELNLSHNPLEELSENVETLSQFSALLGEGFKFIYNRFKGLPEQLRSIDLSQSTLDLSNCGLEEIPELLLYLPVIRNLNLSCNPIKTLPENWMGLRYLESLDLSHCKLPQLPLSFNQLNNLKWLNLSYCHFKEIPASLDASTHFALQITTNQLGMLYRFREQRFVQVNRLAQDNTRRYQSQLQVIGKGAMAQEGFDHQLPELRVMSLGRYQGKWTPGHGLKRLCSIWRNRRYPTEVYQSEKDCVMWCNVQLSTVRLSITQSLVGVSEAEFAIIWIDGTEDHYWLEASISSIMEQLFTVYLQCSVKIQALVWVELDHIHKPIQHSKLSSLFHAVSEMGGRVSICDILQGSLRKNSISRQQFNIELHRHTIKIAQQLPLTYLGMKGYIDSMVYVPAGEFWMGSIRKMGVTRPRYRVKISQPFWIGQTPVTQALWEAVMENNPSHIQEPALPVDQVSWFDCIHFCNKLSEKDGLSPAYQIGPENIPEVNRVIGATGYRVPTEAEWEYAAKGGQNFVYAGGYELDQVGWFGDNSEMRSHPVGLKRPNRFGLYDCSGNLWEWCMDSYSSGDVEWPSEEITDPCHLTSYGEKVIKGGGWSTEESYCSITHRATHTSVYHWHLSGLRLVRSV